MTVKVIVTIAASRNNVIGLNGKLPWHAPSDLKRFRLATEGKAVLMGRKTWDSLPAKKLPGRICSVVTSRPIERKTPGGEIGVFHNTTYAVDLLTGIIRNNPHLPQVLHLIGGAQLLEEAFAEDLVDEVRLTRMIITCEGDTYFKPAWLANFRLASQDYLNEENGDEPAQCLEVYRRIQ